MLLAAGTAGAQSPFPGQDPNWPGPGPVAPRPGNQAPEISASSELSLQTGAMMETTVSCTDPDGDAVRIWAVGLPSGAGLTPAGPNDARLVWTPAPGQSGRHTVALYCMDASFPVSTTLQLLVDEEWESFMLPGVRYGAYAPVDRDTLGILHGPSVEFLIGAWIHRNDNRGPSHGRVFAHLDLFFSTKSGVSEALFYTLGTTLSVERNPHRRFLIPYFGLELGGLYQKTQGNVFYA